MKARSVQVHIVSPPADAASLSEKLGEFRMNVIRSRLNRSLLTTDQKIEVIDRMIQALYTPSGT